MMKIRSAASALLFVILLSCTNGNNKELSMMAPATDEAAAYKSEDQSANISHAPITERKVVKKGEITFQTKSNQETTNFIKKTVNELKGYISSENVYSSDNRVTQRIEIRIPATSFDDLLSRISDNAGKIDSRNVQVEDVTEEYIDIDSRIKTKKELENRYRELLSKAGKVDEILSIERELGTLRSDIEATEGRLKYLTDQVSLSTLTVEYYQLTGSTFNFSSKLGQAVAMGWKFFLSFIIGIVHLWPFILISAIVVIIVLRISRKSKRKENPI